MELPRLCVDIDNVVAQSDEIMRKVILEETGVDLRYEDVREFNYCDNTDSNERTLPPADWERVHARFSEPGNLARISVMPGVLHKLQDLSRSFAIHFATSRLQHARASTIHWLETNKFDFEYDLHFIDWG